MALRVKTIKQVKIRPIPDALPDERIARNCDCCGTAVPYFQKNEMVRCQMKDTYLTTNVFICLGCAGEKSQTEIEALALQAMGQRVDAIQTAMDNAPSL